MRKRFFLFAIGMSIAIASIVAWPQEANRIPVVGVLTLTAGATDPFVEALRQGLRELGYVEGRNIKFEFRTAQDQVNRLPRLAEELVRLNVDVIVVTNALAAQALRRATSTIPIVVALLDPVAAGLVTNLARPGGNITGLSFMGIELSAKRLQLLKEAIPPLNRVAVLWNPDTPSTAKMVEDLKAVASSMSIELTLVSVQTPEGFDAAFATVARANAQGLYVVGGPLFYAYRTTLAKLATKARLPGIAGARYYADGGGLMSYGASMQDQMHRAAVYVDKILKGAKPGDLPIEQPTMFELVVNLKTAKALGITIPESILLRADEVIR
ncbi:MAG TPA: ABC transporter substrate-binding protein [Burkholderiales bacterium]|nr:ABC transporter substrate-binding protein [Burkholderiales bacterium]